MVEYIFVFCKIDRNFTSTDADTLRSLNALDPQNT